mmetsp:Transcript_21888/g.19429  ORF Transcript_21888/g.19429 Transcript_21888/m.19429 type:complete len:201 (-) Transcript_21888:114-716(-)
MNTNSITLGSCKSVMNRSDFGSDFHPYKSSEKPKRLSFYQGNPSLKRSAQLLKTKSILNKRKRMHSSVKTQKIMSNIKLSMSRNSSFENSEFGIFNNQRIKTQIKLNLNNSTDSHSKPSNNYLMPEPMMGRKGLKLRLLNPCRWYLQKEEENNRILNIKGRKLNTLMKKSKSIIKTRNQKKIYSSCIREALASKERMIYS